MKMDRFIKRVAVLLSCALLFTNPAYMVCADEGIVFVDDQATKKTTSGREASSAAIEAYVLEKCGMICSTGDGFVTGRDVSESLWHMGDVSNTGICISGFSFEEWLSMWPMMPTDNTAMTTGCVLECLYEYAGRPISVMPDEAFGWLASDDMYYDVVAWAFSSGLVIEEETAAFDLYDYCSLEQYMSYLYYMNYPRDYARRFPITVDEFLASCHTTMETARLNGYKYGCSVAANPTTDGLISCDRLVAKALYDLGYTDQPIGGITCGNMDSYLAAHGFVRSTSWADVKRGSIMLVKHTGKTYISHAFVFASDFNLETMRGDRYDAGSDNYIQSPQPIRDVGFWYRTDDIIVYNIP